MLVSKKRFNEINKELDRVVDKLGNLEKKYERLSRILTYQKEGKISVFCPINKAIDDDSCINTSMLEECTYIYKDNKEYKINDLNVHENVDIHVDENDENTLYITSRDMGKMCDKYIIENNYIVNLKDRRYLFLNSKSILKNKKKTE